jgi:hypothetical protein
MNSNDSPVPQMPTKHMTGEEVFNCIKADLPQEQVDELTLAAQAVAHLLVVTEGPTHVEAVKNGPLDHPLMCLVRGVELGFMLGYSAGDKRKASEEEKLPCPPGFNPSKIFEDMRTRRSLIDAGLEGSGNKEGADGLDLPD